MCFDWQWQTAHENYKRRYTRSPNPFDKGVLRNIKEILFKRLGASRVNFRAEVEPEYGYIARMLMNSNKLSREADIEIKWNHQDLYFYIWFDLYGLEIFAMLLDGEPLKFVWLS